MEIELDSADRPSIVITKVSPQWVEFEVRNTTPQSYTYPGWPSGSTLAKSQALKDGVWQDSFITSCGTGSSVNELGPGLAFHDSLPNRNEGDMRICLSFKELANEPEADSSTWVDVQSEAHADWTADPAMPKDRASADR